MVERIKSGIAGYDVIIGGGLVQDSVNLVSGGAGTGKTLFSVNFVLNGAKLFNERGVYFTVEEREVDVRGDIEAIGLGKDASNRLIKFVHCPIYETLDFPTLLDETLAKHKPKRVVIDSVSALTMPMEDNFERRKAIYQIIDILKRYGCTSLLTSEITNESAVSSESMGKLSSYDIEEFLCDSVSILYYAGIGGESDRAIRVVKMRRTNHARGPVPMQIGKLGIKILKSDF